MKKTKPFRWYRIQGEIQREYADVKMTFTVYIEATSPQGVLKTHGGRRTKIAHDGSLVTVMFPRTPQGVKQMATNFVPVLSPDKGADDVFGEVQVIPATRYVCQCGKVHMSEVPYPSVWCSCGQKAYPEGSKTHSTGFAPSSVPRADVSIGGEASLSEVSNSEPEVPPMEAENSPPIAKPTQSPETPHSIDPEP